MNQASSHKRRSERERIAALQRRFAFPCEAVMQGIGDDAAVLREASGAWVTTVDAQVEGVHFESAWIEPFALGYRAVQVALSDVAAMGARAHSMTLALNLPEHLGEDRFDGIIAGVAEAATACRCPVVGGNLAGGSELSITVQALGLAEQAWLRSGAKPGDAVLVSGPLGGARFGLECLLDTAWTACCVPFQREAAIARWQLPRARLDLTAQLRCEVHAAIDISDGLLTDLGHICQASRCDALLDLGAIPIHPVLAFAAPHLPDSPVDFALQSGEEYELVVIGSPELAKHPALHRIGTMASSDSTAPTPPGRLRLRATAAEHNPGFDHFRSAGGTPT